MSTIQRIERADTIRMQEDTNRALANKEVYRLIEILNRERKRQGLSYRDLAEAIGYKREQMNQVAIIFGHKVTPRLDTLLRIMSVMGLTFSITIKE